MSPTRKHTGGRLTTRESVAYAVLTLFLAISAWCADHGQIMGAWAIGAAGFVVAAAIAGKDIDDIEDGP